MMSLTVVDHQAAVPPPSYQRAQAKQSPALHMNALALVTTLRAFLNSQEALQWNPKLARTWQSKVS